MNTESQELALQVNEFYRDSYRGVMRWLVLMILLCAILTAIATWMLYDRKQPPYYAAATTGTVVRMHALSEPVISTDFVVEWSALTARLVYNLAFEKYQTQLARAKPRFTDEGWQKMVSALQSSGLLENLVNNRLIISSVVSQTPVILVREILHGRFTWRVQMPLLVTYTGASSSVQRTLIVTMDVQRVPTFNAPQGIQVVNFSTHVSGEQ